MEKEKIKLTIPKESGFTHILLNLAAQGYSHLRVDYSGGCDEGGIETILLLPVGSVDENNELTIENVEYPTLESKELIDKIENIIYEYILNDLGDWCNNEGGYGNILISMYDGTYVCNHNIYYQEIISSIHEGKLLD